jgi:hypothetical protein
LASCLLYSLVGGDLAPSRREKAVGIFRLVNSAFLANPPVVTSLLAVAASGNLAVLRMVGLSAVPATFIRGMKVFDAELGMMVPRFGFLLVGRLVLAKGLLVVVLVMLVLLLEDILDDSSEEFASRWIDVDVKLRSLGVALVGLVRTLVLPLHEGDEGLERAILSDVVPGVIASGPRFARATDRANDDI